MKIMFVNKNDLKETLSEKEKHLKDKALQNSCLISALEDRLLKLEKAIPELAIFCTLSDKEVYKKYQYVKINDLNIVIQRYFAKRYGKFVDYAKGYNKCIGEIFEDVIFPMTNSQEDNINV